MADCRTIRKTSGETISSSTMTGAPSSVLNPVVPSAAASGGCPRSGSFTTTTAAPPTVAMTNDVRGQNLNSSNSYHRYHPNPQQIQQQQPTPPQYQENPYFNCNNNNYPTGYGYPPPPGGSYPPAPLSPHHYPHQHPPQQFGVGGGGGVVGGNAFGNGFNRNNNNQNNNQPPPHQEPPPRPWMQLTQPKHKRGCFTVLCYNILCSRYASHTLYSYCPGWALDWNYRRKAILQELIHYSPDIISLQEMETDQFYNFFLPQLQLLGYSGIFAAKSRARTMVESKRKMVDGCAIFYRTNKFRLLSEHLIEFSQVAIENATRGSSESFSEEMINRVQTKDNIALAALLEAKMDSEHCNGHHGLANSTRSRPLLVCTCHIHWDPNFCDVKLVQTMLLMQELRKITDTLDVNQSPLNEQRTETPASSPTSSSPQSQQQQSTLRSSSNLEKVNLLVCGDFNSLPQSGVVQFMEKGTVPSTHPDFKGHSYEGYVGYGRGSPRGGSDSPTTSSPNIPNTPSAGTTSTSSPSTPTSTSSGSIPLPPVTPSSPTQEEEFSHDFNLDSAYPHDTMPFTNYTLEFQGVIDYIFHSVQGLRPVGFLGPLDPTWLIHNNIVGAPHPWIPSDHFPLLVELEMITTAS